MQTISFGSKATMAQNVAQAGKKAVQKKMTPQAAQVANKGLLPKPKGGVGGRVDAKA
ncbi:MAG: hypothetical protein K0Q50_1422 [Vampirovibrio sp.]|jgi:hypothetical protein|nr:hypothetical protein [Vampirovibrio sp.]